VNKINITANYYEDDLLTYRQWEIEGEARRISADFSGYHYSMVLENPPRMEIWSTNLTY